MPSFDDGFATTASFTLISLAAAMLAVAFPSSVVFKGSLQQSLPALFAINKMLISYSVLKPSENALYWSVFKLHKILDLGCSK